MYVDIELTNEGIEVINVDTEPTYVDTKLSNADT
jgi:hypothetical protein